MKNKLIELCDEAFIYKIKDKNDYKCLISKIHAAPDFLVVFNKSILGYAAMYANNVSTKIAYITLIGVRREFQDKHVGKS